MCQRVNHGAALIIAQQSLGPNTTSIIVTIARIVRGHSILAYGVLLQIEAKSPVVIYGINPRRRSVLLRGETC